MSLSPGTLLNNRYRISSILGQGGMGAVYRAIDEHLNVEVAVKENLYLADEYTRQFQTEASILAKLRQSGLPQVRDYFSVPNQGQYLVMDFIEGEDLRTRIESRGRMPDKDVTLIGVLICDALTYLHTRTPSIVHRDIKPGNIKITPEGEAILVDFGLAKEMKGSQATSTGARAMTPGFSPPEQYGTARTDPRTDIYSLGATMYASLTGAIPEDGLAPATGKEELTPLRSLEPKVGRKLAAVIEKSMELEPEDRFQTAKEFRSALLEAGDLSQLTISRIHVPPPPIQVSSAAVDSDSANPFKPIFLEDGPAGAFRTHGSRSKRRARRNYLWAGALILTLAFVAALVLIIPDLPARLGAFVALVPSPSAAPTQKSTTATVMPSQPPPPTLEAPTATSPAAASPVPLASPTSRSAGLPEIVFASSRSGTLQLWLMNADGKNLVQLTDNPDGACLPSWSPDGNKLVFISPCQVKDNYAGARIYTVNADGKNMTPLPIPNNPEGDYEPAWSPDGKKIAYTSRNGNFSQIYLYNFDTSTTLNISNSPASIDSTPTWSPDGTQIAFSRLNVTSQIWLMTDTGEKQTPFNSIPANLTSFGPAWSEDGQIIYFSQMRTNTAVPWLQGLRLKDVGTNQDFRIPRGTTDIGPVMGIRISPDGMWVVYESWPDGKNHDIFRMTINGADRTQLTNDPAFDFCPAWRPGGIR